MSGFPVSTLNSTDELGALYRQPSEFVRNKKHAAIDDGSRAFIAASPLAFIASTGPDGSVDVSPRGGDPGFIRIIVDGEQQYLAVPDLRGNNLVDTLRNVVATGAAGVIVVVPGRDDTVRVNGAAAITADPSVLDLFTEVTTPTSALLVRADEVYVHCAKAFRRSKVWHASTWLDDVPDLADIVRAQGLDVDGDTIRADLEANYQRDLDAERA